MIQRRSEYVQIRGMNARDLRELSDSDLAVALAGGEVEALGELYDRYGSLAFAVAVRVVGDSGRAEDVVQEAFLKVWRSAGSFDATSGPHSERRTGRIRNG